MKLGIDPATIENLVERVLVKNEMGFQDSYEIVEDSVSVSQFQRKVTLFSESMHSLQYQRMKEPEKDKLREALYGLRDTINVILQSL